MSLRSWPLKNSYVLVSLSEHREREHTRGRQRQRGGERVRRERQKEMERSRRELESNLGMPALELAQIAWGTSLSDFSGGLVPGEWGVKGLGEEVWLLEGHGSRTSKWGICGLPGALAICLDCSRGHLDRMDF